MTTANDFLAELSPTQEHFLKKFVIEKRLENELSLLSRPDCLQLFGEPFKSHTVPQNKDKFPLLGFFFDNYVANFPFVTNNSKVDQLRFWQHTVQPFVESINSKHLSNSNDRKEHITKRKQVNKKCLSGLSLFFNSMIVTEKDMVYLTSDHLRPSDVGKLDKLKPKKGPVLSDIDYTKSLEFNNGILINVVAVEQVNEDTKPAAGLRNWLGYGAAQQTHHFEFVIQVTREHDRSVSYVSRPYHEFKMLEKRLVQRFPGIMKIQTSKLPEKYKQDANTLMKEKLRLALRGYLNQLTGFPEITNSDEFQQFITNDSFTQLSEAQQKDSETRQAHEKQIIATQYEFQKQVSKIMIDFTKSFDEFKALLIKDPDTLVKLFQEIGAKANMDDLSPLLKIFIEWCKIETSATIFQVFLTQDNSNELLNNLRKFHRSFPYSVMYNILRFTNPMSIISKVISLLLITLPGTNKTMLSMLFIMLLDDDLSGYETEIKEVKQKLKQYPNLANAVEKFIKDELIDSDLELDENVDRIIKSQKDNPRLTEAEAVFINGKDNNDTLNNLKQLFQLRIRQNDKMVLKAMWSEPEITALIKNFLIIFYQPLIKLLSRSNMHVFFKEFKFFMEDMIELLVRLNEEEMYYSSSIEIFNKLMTVVDKHIITFWRFVHDLYNNDRDQLFVKLIKWIQNFLLKLRLKYVDVGKVTINLMLEDVILDKEAFFNQLNERMNKVIMKRKLFKEHFSAQEKSSKSSNTVEQNWDQLHEALNDYDEKFGLDIEELQELNYDINASPSSNDKTDTEFHRQLAALDAYKYGTSELDKFDGHVTQELARVLGGISNE